MRPLRRFTRAWPSLKPVCVQCARSMHPSAHRQISRAATSGSVTASVFASQLKSNYFLFNSQLDSKHGSRRSSASAPAASVTAGEASTERFPKAETSTEQLPHRRRQAAKRRKLSAIPPVSDQDARPLPPDAPSVLSDVAARQPAHSFRRQISALLALSKPRLTVLVVLSAIAPYALYPVPSFLSATALADAAPSLSPLTLLFLTTGTTLCSASANALNMLYEPSTDALMSRTRNRPLVRNLVSRRAAVLFAVVCAVAGTAALYLGVNPTVAFLGGANIALYAGVYTPMKRLHWLNTWIGAVVGGIPPLMGWAAAAGESATGDGSFSELLLAPDGSSIGGWLLAGFLFAWQFPHFMALSWPVREEYKAAGLRMLAWVNPARNGRVALRYSLFFVPLCFGLCAVGVTEWSFAVTSLPVNAWLIREAWRFWRLEGQSGAARGLFWASVWHLPVIMVLALVQKKGMWQRVWRSLAGEPDEEDELWEDDDELSPIESSRQVPISGTTALGAPAVVTR
jgi:heme o synthase